MMFFAIIFLLTGKSPVGSLRFCILKILILFVVVFEP